MKKIGRLVLLLIIIIAIGASVLVAETEVFANQLVLSSEIIDPVDPVDGKYSVSYAEATEGKQYLLLVVTGKLDNGTNLTLTDSNINYIDQAEATADGVKFENFIPRNIEDSTVFLTGADLAETIVLGYIYGSGSDRIAGDVNGDSNVNLKDVVVLKRNIAGGWNATINEANSNVNGDEVVNLKDVVLIKRFVAGGWDVELK